MNGIVIRLAGVPLAETRIFHQEVISIGTAADGDVVIDGENLTWPSDTPLLTLCLKDGLYRIETVAAPAELTRDGEPVAVGEAVRDGDTLYFGATGIRLRFFALSDETELTESLRLGTAVLARVRPTGALPAVGELTDATTTAAATVTAPPRTDVAIVFVKQLLRELAAEIPRKWLYVITGAGALTLGTMLYVGLLSFIEGRRNNQAIGELKQTMGDTRKEIERMRDDLLKAQQDTDRVTKSLSLAARVVESYGQSVCLIFGSYSFYDPRAGRDARFRELGETNNPISPNGGLNLSADGLGRIYEVEFIGTGFLVEKGMALTNRHVLQPWEDDPVASLIRAQGFRPRVRELLAYFPKIQQPFGLRQLDVATERDVALCGFEQGDVTLPVLPLDEKDEGAVSGQTVVLIGYPAGLDGLLARVDERERWGLTRLSLRTALNELAVRAQIRPQSTQGHIGDITPKQLVYDAQTGEGGSGGPVFGYNGRVIGINQAVLPNTPSNFGVPIRYGIELLNKHKPQPQAQLQSAPGAVPAPGRLAEASHQRKQ